MASPVRLMRRSIRKTPTGQAAERQHQRAGQRALHEAELDEGGDEKSYMDALTLRRGRSLVRVIVMMAVIMVVVGMAVIMAVTLGLAPRRIVVPRLVETPGAQAGFPAAASRARRPPGHRAARQKQRFGKMLAHKVEIVDDDHHRALLAVPALDQRDQVGDRPGVDRVERLVEQDEVGILHQHARKQRALQLPAGKRVDRPRSRTRRGRRPSAPWQPLRGLPSV